MILTRETGATRSLRAENRFASRIGHFNTDVRLARHAIDANRFGFERQTKIVNERYDARVLHARIGFEFVSGDNRTGTDVFDLAGDIELFALFGETRGEAEQFGIGLFAVWRSFVEKLERRQTVVAVIDDAREASKGSLPVAGASALTRNTEAPLTISSRSSSSATSGCGKIERLPDRPVTTVASGTATPTPAPAALGSPRVAWLRFDSCARSFNANHRCAAARALRLLHEIRDALSGR